CVGSYTSKIAKKDSLILSLRYAKSPDHSEVTVELIPDSKGNFTILNQAFAQSDSKLTDEQNTALATFISLAKIKMSDHLGGTNQNKLRLGLNKHKQEIDLTEIHQKSMEDYQSDIEEMQNQDNSWAKGIK